MESRPHADHAVVARMLPERREGEDMNTFMVTRALQALLHSHGPPGVLCTMSLRSLEAELWSKFHKR